VTGKAVSHGAVERAGQFLRQLSSARQVFALYPAGHPKRVEAIQEALDAVRRLRNELRAEPVLFVTRHALYLGPVLLARDSLSRYGLVEAFERAGVEAVEPRSSVSEADLDKLVRILLGELGMDAEFEGLAINRVKPSLDAQEDDGGQSVLRRKYALGLEILRHTGASVVAGQRIDLAGPTRLVTDLSEQVMQDPTQALMLATIRSHDEYTYYHMLNVCLLSIAMGYAVGLRTDQIVSLGLGALLHDIGKVSVPVEVLQHVGALSPEQWRLIQRHPVEGAGIIFSTGESLTHLTAAIVLEHHAAFDLTGYPAISRRSHPSLPARMVAVADCFDAVTTTRPYRRAEERRQALNILLSGAGRGYDPRVVRAFVRLQGLFPIGSLVRLANGAAGVVIRNHETLLARPRVRIVLDPKGEPCEPFELDLSETRTDGSFRWAVERSMDPDEVGVDMVALVLAGALESLAPSTGPQPGLVHEPAHGEVPPPGYVQRDPPQPRMGMAASLD
jgi:HD-GYP domain-containing protein (c-di-GMP phosphodiesterase class II)